MATVAGTLKQMAWEYPASTPRHFTHGYFSAAWILAKSMYCMTLSTLPSAL